MKNLTKILSILSLILIISLSLSSCGDSSTTYQPVPPNLVRGDVNLNNVAYEIADAVLLTSFFIYGDTIFDINRDSQIEATDANADGLMLSVADMVYLVRVIIGDALPYDSNTINKPIIGSINYSHTHNGLWSISDGALIGAAFLVLEGNVTPTLLANNMEMLYNFDSINTSILIYSLDGHSFTGEFLDTNGASIVSIEVATHKGSPVELTQVTTK